jgi:nickel/cobalt transporter (NicO) family protein
MNELTVLIVSAATIGFFHTITGPDHYLPFIVMSKAKKWSQTKTLLITIFCGLGHVASSVIIGFAGLALGVVLNKLSFIEGVRGNIAAWMLIGFGLAYTVWGLHRVFIKKQHVHEHIHEDGELHSHTHNHTEGHSHVHNKKGKTKTPWILFLIFVFGPCEPLIPILMYPAAKSSVFGVVLVVAVFGIATIGTMTAVVMASFWGLKRISLKPVERFSHIIAGFTIFSSGMAIQFLGL